MKKLLLCNTFASALALSSSGISNAAALDFIDQGTYTTDSISGLDWLDLTITTGQSYNQVSNQLAMGGLYHGWRYASAAEFNAMITNYTGTPIPPGFVNQINHAEGAIDGLHFLLGSTLDSAWQTTYGTTYDAYVGRAEGEGIDYTWGLLSDGDTNGRFLAMIFDNDRSTATLDYTMVNRGRALDSLSQLTFGSYLVRDTQLSPVPVPAALPLFASVLLGFSLFRRRKYNQST